MRFAPDDSRQGGWRCAVPVQLHSEARRATGRARLPPRDHENWPERGRQCVLPTAGQLRGTVMTILNTARPAGNSPPAGVNDRMAIDWWPVGKLWQAAKNPRRYTAKEIKKAERIIKR